ncbi:protein Gawky isoform X1 [Lucilia sericata]|uniref:protein Gawky isoform X1 n=1 Tax=Lucilia sericata TaxID=13632 RepID=UPI0018A7EAA3|nr:protein Gawky isoform X1 [Lucilia sericata]
MLAANLPVCQYAGMSGQSNSSIANSSLNNNNSNTSTNCSSNIICNQNSSINNNNNNITSIGNSSSNNHNSLVASSSVNTNNSQSNTNISNIINNNNSSSSNILINNNCSSVGGNSNIIIGNNGGLALDHHIGGLVGGGTSTAAAKNQLEQLNTMREALFSQDGWGCQHVNQDTNWEVPSSPEPTNKDPSGPPMWKPTINNGTDLWESNLRNGGQPTTQPVQKTPWGHTPSTNLGGTWGEDDDCTDASNVWTGGPTGPSAVGVSGVTPGSGASGPSNGPQWGQGVGVSGAGVQAAVAAPTSITGVAPGGTSNAGGVNLPGTPGAGGASGAGNGWGDPRVGAMGGGGGPLDMRSVDPRDPMRAASAGDPRELRMLDPRDPIRGDPRGISGRLNGTSEMWGQHHPIAQHQMPGLNKMGVGGPNVSGVGNVGAAPGAGGLTGPSSVGGLNAAGNVVGSQWGAPPQSVVGAPKDMVGSMAPKPPVSGSGWEEPSPPPQRRNIPNYDDGTSLWGQQSRVPGGVGGGGGSHWKEISDPLNPRNHLMRSAMGGQNSSNVSNMGGAGGGSAGNSSSGGAGVGSTVNPNNPMGVGAVGPPGARLVSAINGPGGMVGGPHKPDNGMWPHPAGPPNVPTTGVGGSRNAGGWGDVENHNVISGAASVSGNGGGNWGDDKSNQAVSNMGQAGNSWNEPPSASAWNKSNQAKLAGATNSTGWGTGVSNAASGANDSNDLNPNDWTTAAHNTIMSKAQQQQKLGSGATVNLGGINSDLIKQSKQYRMLVETGFKKEDVERSLIATNMNYDEATEMLRANLTAVNAGVGMDNWRRHDDNLSSYADHNAAVAAAGGSFHGRYTIGGTQPAISFPPNNLLNSMGGGSVGASGGNNPQLNALNSMQPLQVQKYLNQGPHNVGAGGPQSVNAAVAFGQGSNVAAVNAAAVNAAAVNAAAVSNSTNQPSTQQLRMLVQQIQLAVQSGYLSSQILNQPLAPTTLLLLNQLLSNIKHLQGAQQSLARNGNNGSTLLAIAKYKQQIQNLQNQINAQQAIYIKQQQALQPTPHPAATHINNTNNEYLRSHDAISALQANFTEMNLNKSGGYQGTPNQQSRLNQWKLPLDKDITTDSTEFSRAPGATKQGAALTTTNASNMGPLGLQGDGTWSTGRNINDGWPDPSNDSENKDWSVGQPSTATAYTDLVQEFEPGKPWKGSQIKSIEDDPSITPGSVARSPLSINPTPKDADIFSNAANKNSPTDLPSLGLTSSSTWSFNPSSSNQNFPSWSDNTQQEIWSSMNKTSRGPPPGLGSNKSGGGGVPNVTNPGNANGWLGGGRTGGWSGTNSNWTSNWLLLKNLTAQIDSSTLRTLCMQHGPLLNFHLYLNQGIALCKYSTSEEARKAQMTLNSCFLGNTTIIAESPGENEVHSILHHLPQQNTNTTATQQQQQAQQGQASSHNNPSAVNSTGGVGGGGGGSSNTNANNVNNVNNASGSQNPSTPGGNNVNGINQQSNNPANNVSSINSANSGSNNANTGQNGNQPSNHNSHPNTSTQNTSNVATNNSNNATNNPSNANNTTGWRSTAQQPQQTQNSQTRPSGGRDDFEFISKYVCSIVDD